MKNIKIFGISSLLLLGVFACREQSDWIENIDYPREFSPVGLNVPEKTHTWAKVTWSALANSTESYVLELYTDSMLFLPENLAQSVDLDHKNEYTFENLYSEVQYSVRIKTVGKTDVTTSKWYGIAFKTDSEQILQSITGVKATKVTVVWAPASEVTHLLFTTSNNDDVQINLSAEQIEAGMATVTGLLSNKTYNVFIYNGIGRRGKLSFKTQYVPEGDNVIRVDAATDIVTLMGDAGNIGKILLLPDGYVSTTNGNKLVTLVGGMTIYGDPDADVQPKIISERTGGNPAFAPVTGTNIDYLKFYNVEILNADPTQGVSMFDWNSIVTECGTIEFDHCYVHDFGRSLLRLRAGSTPQSLQNLIITDCVFENIGETGANNLFIYTGANALLKNVTISKSTFHNLDLHNSFMQFPGVEANLTTDIKISECTFHDIVGSATSARYFIDCTGATNVTLEKNIFGKTKDAVDGGLAPLGIKTKDKEKVTQTGNFKASEWATEAGEGVANIEGSALGSFNTLFKDADNGNFTLKSDVPSSVKQAGDPRWW